MWLQQHVCKILKLYIRRLSFPNETVYFLEGRIEENSELVSSNPLHYFQEIKLCYLTFEVVISTSSSYLHTLCNI